MRIFPTLLLLLFGVLCLSCQPTAKIDQGRIEEEIATVLYGQMQFWNQGDIEGYMSGYDHSDSLRFASGANVSYGWQTTLERYQKGYPDQAAMGVLKFSDIDITIISEDAALVFGTWQLQKADANPWGLFTLLFRKTQNGWRIVHDHTSSADE